MKKLEERRFVVFGAAIIDVDLIVAMVDLPPNAKRPAATIAVVLEKGSPIMLDGVSMLQAVQWWKENVKVEKIELKELPPPLEAPAEPVPVSPVTAPVATPAPAKTPATPPTPVAPKPVSVPVETPVIAAEPDKPVPSLADLLSSSPTDPNLPA